MKPYKIKVALCLYNIHLRNVTDMMSKKKEKNIWKMSLRNYLSASSSIKFNLYCYTIVYKKKV